MYVDNNYRHACCSISAYEILGVPSKRRSYDSIDPEFDDSIPSVNAESKEHFYESFRPVFERNARYGILAIYEWNVDIVTGDIKDT